MARPALVIISFTLVRSLGDCMREGREGIRDRQPKVIDFCVDLDGETRALRRRVEAHFPHTLVRKQFLHLCQGFHNRSVRGSVLRSSLHSAQGYINSLFFLAPVWCDNTGILLPQR